MSERVVLAHGGGGEMSRELLERVVFPKLSTDLLNPLGDSAVLDLAEGRIAFTTDSYVVQPLEFPGGDIGRLAVCGTVNDLAVMGARPVALSLGLILEEGLEIALLDRVMASVASAAEEAGVRVATGDTKVIESAGRGGLMINTAGVGVMPAGFGLSPRLARPGDAIVVSGNLAEHGMTVMAAREGLGITSDLASDVAPLWGMIEGLRVGECGVRFMRDPTRGGLAGVLADIAEGSGLSVEIDEASLPVTSSVRHAAELLGLDPLTVANEGKIVAVVAAEHADALAAKMREHRYGRNAAVIGRMVDASPAVVELVTKVGGRRLVQRPYGEDLPRIC